MSTQSDKATQIDEAKGFLESEGYSVYRPYTATERVESNLNRTVADLSLAIDARADGGEITDVSRMLLDRLAYRVDKLLIGEIPDE